MSLPHLILGILKYGPQSGYDLNKAFQASVEHFWNTEQSQIYRSLAKLHEAGWVEIERVAQEKRPDKKMYHITEKGLEVLRDWLATPHGLASSHEAWLGQVFFGIELSKGQLKQVLEQRIADLQQQLAHFEQTIPTSAALYAETYNAVSDLPYWLLTLDYGLQKLHFDLRWAQTALASLDHLPEKREEQKE
ncbi:transcriptional regulator [Ktedonobacter sp. SOSP1-85]|uniref:PadR family transcriptional regulator n=1 Tax=Ktedonobacter sp. SOSP1-85 TaxID=2778367 RepID=UPI001915E066|nr:PadR family transcriptional regulator [Ktedonobacter sp. SOSP1-85]GHO78913.1 transcriptional regulator [Ktedonobacter sp. SOSP1-85]